MIVVLPQADAIEICDAIRAKGYTIEKMTTERAGLILDQFVEPPTVVSITAPAYKSNLIIDADFINPSLPATVAPAYKSNLIIDADFINPNISTTMEVN